MSSHHQKNTEFDTRNLPKGWVKTKLENLCGLIGGGTPSRKNPEYFGGDIVWLTPTEIPKDQITKISNSRERITNLGLQKSSAKTIPQDSVLDLMRNRPKWDEFVRNNPRSEPITHKV